MPETRSIRHRLQDATRVTWHFGITCFGGPPIHFQIFYSAFVQKLKWIDEQMYQELFSISQALPGPASTKMLYCISQMRNGLLAGIITFLYWSMPGAIGMYGLSLGISTIQDTLPPAVYSLLSGLNAATTGVIALAAIGLSEKTATDQFLRAVLFLSASAALLYSAVWYLPVLMVASGCATLLYDMRIIHKLLRRIFSAVKRRKLFRSDVANTGTSETATNNSTAEHAGSSNDGYNLSLDEDDVSLGSDQESRVVPPQYPLKLRWKQSCAIIGSFIAAFVAIMVLRAVLSNPSVLYKLFSNLWLAGTIIFGGGPVVIPLLREYIVAEGWVSSRDFLIGLAITQAFPGPNFNFAVFLGSLTAINNGYVSIAGAIVGFLGIFTPGMVLVQGTMGIWVALRSRRWVKSLVRGVSTSAVGFIFTAVYRIWQIGYLGLDSQSGKSLGDDPWWLVVAAAAFVGGRYFNTPPPICIGLGAVLGLVRFGVVASE